MLSSNENYAVGITKIKDAKYYQVSPKDVASRCLHISPQHQQQLSQLYDYCPILFSGQVVWYNKSKFNLKLKYPSTTLILCLSYPIVQTHMEVIKKELRHLIYKSNLQHISRSEWPIPTFLIPEKDERIRWVSDFRKNLTS